MYRDYRPRADAAAAAAAADAEMHIGANQAKAGDVTAETTADSQRRRLLTSLATGTTALANTDVNTPLDHYPAFPGHPPQ